MPTEATSLTWNEETRFWSYVAKGDGCWLWQGGLTGAGYGNFAVRRGRKVQNQLAHRMAHTLLCGPIPHGLFVLHTCDTPACVNPDHLFIGNQADNMTDKCQKGRQARGERNGFAKLNWTQVRAIRSMSEQGSRIAVIAATFGIHRDTVSLIRRRKLWIEKEN